MGEWEEGVVLEWHLAWWVEVDDWVDELADAWERTAFLFFFIM